METLKLTKEESEAFVVLLFFTQLSDECLKAEKRGVSVFTVHIRRRPPRGNRGQVFKKKPVLYAEFLSETESGWIGAIKCTEFKSFLQKNYNDTPEGLTGIKPVAFPD